MPQQLDVDRLDLEAGDEAQRALDGRHGAERLLVAVAVQQRACHGAGLSGSGEAAGVGFGARGIPRSSKARPAQARSVASPGSSAGTRRAA